MSRLRWLSGAPGKARSALRGTGHAAVVLSAVAAVAFAPAAASADSSASGSAVPAVVAPSDGALGPNVYVFTPDMPQATIQSTLTAIGTQQNPNQFGTERYALLFEPGTYGSAADPLVFQVGYYTEVAGLGLNPDQTVINGSIDSYNQCLGSQSNCNATDDFWRSISNLTINVAGGSGCQGNTEFWASSQASPLRRVDIHGNVSLMDYCDGSPDYASGGFIADSRFSGAGVTNGSQQQYIVRDSDIDNWTNGVWNQVFCGDPGAPAQSFAGNSGDSGGPAPYTTLASCPVTQEEPYLYVDSAGAFNVFVPAVQTSSNGPTWTNGNTPGTSLPLSSFFVAYPSTSVTAIQKALDAGQNLLLTPGVYDDSRSLAVTHADTKVIGLGFPTIMPTQGNLAMTVSDVGGVNISDIIFDAGPVTSRDLLTIGSNGSGVSHAADPVTVDDVFFRIGGATAGSATTSFVDSSDNSILDDVWAWRADHGAGGGSWTSDTAQTGVIVNGDDVTAYGLAVEHYQGYETIWNGQDGTVLFFQNENPYEVPDQAAWMANPTEDGYPAFKVSQGVTSFNGYGMGSYSYFDQGVDIENSMAFQAPVAPGVQFHDLLTVFLTGSGGIQSVINGTGAPVGSAFGGPSDVVSYP